MGRKPQGAAPGAARAPPPHPPTHSPLAPAAEELIIPSTQGRASRPSTPEEFALSEQIALHEAWTGGARTASPLGWGWQAGELSAAYERCGDVTSEYAKTFYLGTQLMTSEQAKAIHAIYVWCRRTDELVDGPNASRITPAVREPLRCFWVLGD